MGFFNKIEVFAAGLARQPQKSTEDNSDALRQAASSSSQFGEADGD